LHKLFDDLSPLRRRLLSDMIGLSSNQARKHSFVLDNALLSIGRINSEAYGVCCLLEFIPADCASLNLFC